MKLCTAHMNFADIFYLERKYACCFCTIFLLFFFSLLGPFELSHYLALEKLFSTTDSRYFVNIILMFYTDLVLKFWSPVFMY